MGRNEKARVLQRGAWSGTLPASPRVNRLTDVRTGVRTGEGTYRISMIREGTTRLVRQASISRDDRDWRCATFESHFLVEKLMGIDIGLPNGMLVSPLGLILAAYVAVRQFTSRDTQFLTGRPLRGANIHVPGFTWGVVLACGWSRSSYWLGRRGMRVVPRKSYSSESSGH